MTRTTAILERCLCLVASEAERDDRLGDLQEAYWHDLRKMGISAAGRRHQREVLSAIASIARRRLQYVLVEETPIFSVAILITLLGLGCFARATAETWWSQRGLERNPGYFVSVNPIDYPVCESIGNGPPKAGKHASELRNNIALVPASAHIAGTYCSAPVAAEGWSDNKYTQGRVFILSDARTTARVWVIWND
jgi:hypothetical protein